MPLRHVNDNYHNINYAKEKETIKRFDFNYYSLFIFIRSLFNRFIPNSSNIIGTRCCWNTNQMPCHLPISTNSDHGEIMNFSKLTDT